MTFSKIVVIRNLYQKIVLSKWGAPPEQKLNILQIKVSLDIQSTYIQKYHSFYHGSISQKLRSGEQF